MNEAAPHVYVWIALVEHSLVQLEPHEIHVIMPEDRWEQSNVRFRESISRQEPSTTG